MVFINATRILPLYGKFMTSVNTLILRQVRPDFHYIYTDYLFQINTIKIKFEEKYLAKIRKMLASPSLNNLKIAIIGAGPGGLTLARLLQQKGIPVTVYERETSAQERPQGGTLDLHEESGQRAVKEAGLWPQVEKILRYEGEDFKLLDKSGYEHINEISEGEGNRPEIDRIQLRQVLLDSIKPEAIQWGHSLLRVEPGKDGKHDLHFKDKVVEGFDLVVGADGAWSKVRPLLTEVVPYYSGISMVEIKFTDVDVRQPKISKLVGRGSMCALSNNKGLIAQRNGDGSVRVYVSLRVPEKYLKECGINFSDPQDARQGLLKIFEDWSQEIKDMIVLCDDNFIPRPLYMLPVGHSWTSKPGVTLLGDSAHLMTPFAGEGVNLAMHDTLDLAEHIVNSKDGLNVAIENYEKEMFKRAGEKAGETLQNLDIIFNEESPLPFKELMQAISQPPAEK